MSHVVPAAPQRRRRAFGIALSVLLAVAGVGIRPGAAHAVEPVLSGAVTGGGGAVAGAFVAVSGATLRTSALTDVDGAYAVADLPDGAYTVAVQASGYRVAETEVTISGGTPVTRDVALTGSGAAMRSIPVHGGAIGTVLSGGTPGVFYATTSVIPQVFRTADFGGHWSPVTLASDDPEHGLSGSHNIFRATHVAVSGYPGELAVIVGEVIHYSTDYGVTWDALSTEVPPGAGETLRLFWGHAGSTSVLLMVNGATSYRADMTAVSPALAEMSTPYSGEGAAVAVADGPDAPWVAVLDSGGTLRLYPLTATGTPEAVGTALDGFPGGSSLLWLGGAATPGQPPSTVLAFSSSTQQVRVALKEDTADSFAAEDRSAATAVPFDCGANMPGTLPVGSISPASGGSAASGTIAGCFLRTNAAGEEVSLDRVQGINNNTGFAFDAGYGGDDNRVILSGDGNRGVIKSAAAHPDTGLPVFPDQVDATAGTGADSGGISVDGITVPVVKDTTFGPSAATFATALSIGGLGYVSDDGGVTTRIAVRKASSAVAWWQGASDTWLVYGHMGAGDLLTALPGWSSATPTASAPNVADTSLTDLGLSGETFAGGVGALTGIPGTDTVFVGMSRGGVGGGGTPAAGSLVRAVLSPGSPPTVTATVPLAAGSIDGGVTSLAYCPASGSATSAADALFVGIDAGTTGAVVKVSGATGDSPSVTVVPTAKPVNTVRATCASGTVWVGSGSNSGGPGGALLRSTDGGATYPTVPISVAGVPSTLNVTALAVNPADPSELLLAANSEGFVLRSTDAGASWIVVNDPARGRNFQSEGIKDLELPPPPPAGPSAAALAPAVRQSSTLVGTGGGLFSGSLRSTTSSGLYLATNRTGTWSAAARVTGTGASASTPAFLVDGTGAASLVYRGADGLYATARTPTGSWAAPKRIPGTNAADRTPVLRRAATGALHLAFTRTSGTVGVYYAAKAPGGAWSTPAKRSGLSGDGAPTLVLDGQGKVHLAFKRTASPAGVYYVTNRSGTWSAPARVPGTGAADVTPRLAVAPTSTTVLLAYARAGTGAGIYTAAKPATTGWTTPTRRSTLTGDSAPSVAMDGTGKASVVFRRTAAPAGLYLVTNRSGTWAAAARVTGTGAADTAPSLVPAGTALHLAFARSGTGAGVYTTAKPATTGWQTPVRRSTSTVDLAPVLAADSGAKDYLLFDRG